MHSYITIFMKNQVCKPLKSLCRLKQSPLNCFQKLFIALEEFGFLQSKVYHSLFTYKIKSMSLAVLVYVDDSLITGNGKESIMKFKVTKVPEERSRKAAVFP